MTVLSAQTIRRLGILTPCLERGTAMGLTFGLGPAGYDLRLDLGEAPLARGDHTLLLTRSNFVLAAACERFKMPNNVQGRVHDKSTLARHGLSVFNTIIDPGFEGYLTLELKFHGHTSIRLRQGQAIAQVVFEFLDEDTEIPYRGKYQNQQAGPQGART